MNYVNFFRLQCFLRLLKIVSYANLVKSDHFRSFELLLASFLLLYASLLLLAPELKLCRGHQLNKCLILHNDFLSSRSCSQSTCLLLAEIICQVQKYFPPFRFYCVDTAIPYLDRLFQTRCQGFQHLFEAQTSIEKTWTYFILKSHFRQTCFLQF